MKQKKPYSTTIFKQLILFTIITSIIPIVIISLILLQKMEKMAELEIMDSYEQLAFQYTQNIQEKMVQYEKSIFSMSKNTIIMEQLESVENDTYEKGRRISAEVFKSLLLESQNEIHNCIVYAANQEQEVYGTRVSTMEAAQNERWYSYFKQIKQKWFYYPKIENGNNYIASLVYDIDQIDVNTFEQKNLGIIKLDVYLDRLFAYANNNLEAKNFDVLVYDEEKNLRYTSRSQGNVLLQNELLNAFEEGNLETDKILQFGEQAVFITKIEPVSLNVFLFFGDRGLSEKRAEVKRLLLPMFLAVLAIVTLGAYIYAARFSKRINLLIHKFKMAETGDLTVTELIPGRDEITVLDYQFSHMLRKLDELIHRNYIQELDKKETQLKNLQLQINPHFLYNTLETISSIAAVQQVFVVCDICEKLGEIFRYSLGKNYGEFVTVEQELHHVQNYIFIQKLRYGNKFEVFYDVEPDAEKCMILRFILQPIVENAIAHGIGPMTGSGTLEITVQVQEEKLLVKIEDDGVGMDEISRQKLVDYINLPAGKHENKKNIGVRNVHQRIRLACGEEYGICVESRSYGGSSFMISFPLKKFTKGDSNV